MVICRRTYLAKQDSIPQREVGERLLLDALPAHTRRVLDLGCGDGRLLAIIQQQLPEVEGVLVDHSPAMLEAARQRPWSADVQFVSHDLGQPLPDLGQFDVVVSSFAIHHVDDTRKKLLYAEIFGLLKQGGVFLNLEHVASANAVQHQKFLDLLGGAEDASNQLAPAFEQVQWLEQAGFKQSDVLWKWLDWKWLDWKWLELALLVGWTE